MASLLLLKLKLTWQETDSLIKRPDGKVFPHLRLIVDQQWVDDMDWWPQVTYGDILNYLVPTI